MIVAEQSLSDAPQLDVALRVFIAIAAIYALASLTQSGLAQRMRRVPAIAMLISGGWLAVLTGMIAGPRALNLLSESTLLAASPLVVVALSWVGLIVGLQARVVIIKAVPAEVWKWVAVDAALAVALASLAAWILGGIWLIESPSQGSWVVMIWATLTCASIGWSPETRSLRPGLGAKAHRLGVLIQAGAGLCGLFSAELSAVCVGLVHRSAEGIASASIPDMTIAILLAAALACVLALGTRVVLGQSISDGSSISVIVLATVAITGGVAASVGLSPIAAAALAGAAIANVRGPLRITERILNRAEPVVATMMFMLAGALMRLPDHPILWAVAALLVASRVVLKPTVMRSSLWHERASLALDGPLARATIRQAPLAIAVAVTAAVFEGSRFSGELLGLVVITGLASSLIGAVQSAQQSSAIEVHE
ncbi:MAG: hypothetical protein EXS00_00340 [Phycisphaerales bacterium]|nr:hypothetical protein [Phycisphaerales bacterium]